MRRPLVLIHRWIGLFTALFLFLAGLTGAIIAWDHELDGLLNPALFHARGGTAAPLSSLALADKLEAERPELRVRYLPLSVEPGHTLTAFVEPTIDPRTKKPRVLGYNQVALDPSTGDVQATRDRGAVSLARENIIPFLYKLHYMLHLPNALDLNVGMLLMGIVAVVWAIDAFVALWLAFPNRKVWRRSLALRFGQGGYKLNFDLHRSAGVWLWPLLLVFAITAISMNLRDQVMRPVVSVFSTLAPSPFAPPVHKAPPMTAAIGRRQALEIAVSEAHRRGIERPPGAVFYATRARLYGVGFFAPGKEHGDFGLGNDWLYIDSATGKVRAALIPGTGSAGDIFMQLQFPIHSGRIAGLFGRIVVTLLGLMIATLSVTGIVIWAKKRRAKVVTSRARARANPTERPAELTSHKA